MQGLRTSTTDPAFEGLPEVALRITWGEHGIWVLQRPEELPMSFRGHVVAPDTSIRVYKGQGLGLKVLDKTFGNNVSRLTTQKK